MEALVAPTGGSSGGTHGWKLWWHSRAEALVALTGGSSGGTHGRKLWWHSRAEAPVVPTGGISVRVKEAMQLIKAKQGHTD